MGLAHRSQPHRQRPRPICASTEFDTFGRKVGYPTSSDGQKPLFDWLRENPHRLHLGRIGFAIDKPEDVRFIQQTLDLWTGTLHSEFEWRGQKIPWQTCCHPTEDMIAVTMQGRVPVVFEFPYGSPRHARRRLDAPGKHSTTPTGGRAQTASTSIASSMPTLTPSASPGPARRPRSNRSPRTASSDSRHATASPSAAASRSSGLHQARHPAATFAAAEKHWATFWNFRRRDRTFRRPTRAPTNWSAASCSRST